ncbi:MAG: S1C family serine protease [Intestinibacillus sp.]
MSISKKTLAGLLAVLAISSSGWGIALGWVLHGDTQAAAASTQNAAAIPAASSSTRTSTLSTAADKGVIAAVASETADSVVEITTESVETGSDLRQYISSGAGSGVVLSSDGYLVTNNHVIDGASKIYVTLHSGQNYAAVLVGTDSKTDIAVLKIEATGLKPAAIGDSDALVVGETAVVVGNPLGQLGGTVTNGIISAKEREITLDGRTMSLLQTNAAINPGNSGGGLFDSDGKLIGIVVAKSSGEDIEGLGFAIPINNVTDIVSQLINAGYVSGRIDLGMSLVDVSNAQTAMLYGVRWIGVYIESVGASSNAAKAGLKAGDRIVSVNGTKISSMSDLNSALDKLSVGDTAQFTIVRSSTTYTVSFTLQEYQK